MTPKAKNLIQQLLRLDQQYSDTLCKMEEPLGIKDPEIREKLNEDLYAYEKERNKKRKQLYHEMKPRCLYCDKQVPPDPVWLNDYSGAFCNMMHAINAGYEVCLFCDLAMPETKDCNCN